MIPYEILKQARRAFQDMRPKTEIYEQIDKCYDEEGNPTHRWPGMSYEEGVIAALQWAVGDSDEVPMED
jgi:hypothetical protein